MCCNDHRFRDSSYLQNGITTNSAPERSYRHRAQASQAIKRTRIVRDRGVGYRYQAKSLPNRLLPPDGGQKKWAAVFIIVNGIETALKWMGVTGDCARVAQQAPDGL